MFKSKNNYKKSTPGSKIKIPLKWYSDLIRIPGTTNEFVLIEWFEEKRCRNKTLWCLGKYMRVTQYQINEINLDDFSNKELTIAIMDDILNLIKIGEYVEENDYYNPVIYKAAKLSNWFGEPKFGYNWYDGEQGLTRRDY
ncbi:MAG: hypothetical protein IKV87_06455 [Methanobrevibacter sp.]|nr:hypothetical protein [Methanobrevibacter sp.]